MEMSVPIPTPIWSIKPVQDTLRFEPIRQIEPTIIAKFKKMQFVFI